ncbi:S28 family serine protease [Streptomyces sp. NPDC004609]|uniref:S28 family serine protease n=1 Tax=Streptomyces sp. NPDC004609 TaxID=3364704 RepID=UPI0036C48096
MRRALTGLLSLAVLLGTATATATGAISPESLTPPGMSTAQQTDIKDLILAIPGMRLIKETPHPDYRFFTLSYRQPIDHRDPSKGTFQQRLTLLHRDTARPSVFHTSGYSLYPSLMRTEPAQIIDGNEVSLEHRFFSQSRPERGDWTTMTIRQAADDQHRLFTELKKIYTKKWISTGSSKGGMTAVFYERFHPKDMDGVVAYASPNDVDDTEDSAYDRFFNSIGTPECRDKLKSLQQEALVRRVPMERRLDDWAVANRASFKTLGSLSEAYEAAVRDLAWNYWQSGARDNCASVPDPTTASDQDLYDAISWITQFSSLSDRGLKDTSPYYYQAGTELGSPALDLPHLKGLTRFAPPSPRTFVPRHIPMAFKPGVMKDIDRWVRNHARRMLFVNGEFDPWSAEPFRLGEDTEDSYVLTAPGTNHYTEIASLKARDKALATARIQEWAGVAPVGEDPSEAEALAPYDATLDRRARDQRHPGLRLLGP